MKRFFQALKGSLVWVWKHASAGIAVALIVGAFALGLWIRGGGDKAPAETAATEHTHNDGGEPQMYTCSMHPQVRLPDPDAKCPICFMDLIPVSGDEGGEGSERRVVLTEAAVKLAQLDTARVGRFFPTAEVRLYGKMTYDQTLVARITSYFSGRLDKLFIDFVGAPVRKGDHLAEIYSPDLLAAFEELRQARLAVDESRTSSDLIRTTTSQTLEASREKLRLYGLTPDQIAKAERGEMTDDRFTVYSPIGGIVTHLQVFEGEYVQTGSPIAMVADLSRLWLEMEAYESQLPLLRWGQRVTFTVESHPGETFDGRVSFIEPIVDDHTRTAAVRVAVDNADGRLKPGMFATAVARTRLSAGGSVLSDELAGKWVSPMHPDFVYDQPGACEVCGMDLVRAEDLGVVGDPASYDEPLVVPKTAVLVTGTRAVVYLKVPNTEKPTFEGREVVLGPRAGDFYLVREGLRAGDEVVTNGMFKIDSAMQIAAKPSMMMPGGGGGGGGHAGHGGQPMAAGAMRVEVPDRFVFGLKPVYAAYFAAQEALAADDLGEFAQASDDIESAIGLVDSVGLVGEPLGAWRRAASRLTLSRPPTDIEAARAAFERISAAVIDLQRRFGHRGSETWHMAYCPMAFDNKGAEWLQKGTQINNPYFGDAMLRCGEVRTQFPPLGEDGELTNKREGHDHE